MSKESLHELRRVEHLVFVTLKYTRTVDIIRSALERMLSTLDAEVDSLFEKLMAKGEIDIAPTVPLLKWKKLEQIFPDDSTIKDAVDFYHKIKKILHSDYRKKEEYRKNVALVTRDEEININTLESYVDKIEQFLKHMESLVEGD